jgi:DNA-binding transcriptional ArsR family regulator
MVDKLINTKELKKANQLLRALNNDTRRQILDFMNGRQGITVTVLRKAIKMEQSAISSHLKILRDEGIVNFHQVLKNRYYYIVYERLEQINAFLKGVTEWTPPKPPDASKVNI